MKYYRKYSGEYLAKTLTLSALEHGVYNLLLDYCYLTGAPIPAALDDIYRMIRVFNDDEYRAVQKVLKQFWHLQADGWHNERADEEMAIAAPVIEAQRKSGKVTAAKRWLNRTPKSVGDSLTDSLTDSSTDSLTDRSTYRSTYRSTDSSTDRSTSRSAIQPLTLNPYPLTLNLEPLTPIPEPLTPKPVHRPTSKSKPRPPVAASDCQDLPDWIPAKAWCKFVEGRKKLKPPMTEHAAELIVAELVKFRAAGENVEAVINQSIVNGWKGVFPVKRNGGTRSVSDHNREVGERFVQKRDQEQGE